MNQNLPSALTLTLSPTNLRSVPGEGTVESGNHRRGVWPGLAADGPQPAEDRGFRVELFEQARFRAGRAGSLVDSQTGQLIDYCPYVALGCCSEFLDFCRRTGVNGLLPANRHAALHRTRRCAARRSGERLVARPAPPAAGADAAQVSLARRALGHRPDIARRLWRAGLRRSGGNTSPKRKQRHGTPLRLASALRRVAVGYPTPSRGTIGAWLRAQGQSPRAIERFWSVVLTSALGETVDHASLAAAQQVFRDGFLASRGASDLLLPRLPLREIFHDRLLRWLTDRGVRVHLGTAVRRVEGDAGRADALRAGRRHAKAVRAGRSSPCRGTRCGRCWPTDLMAAMPAMADVERIEPAAITAVHLWFDRPVVPLPHAVLVGRLGQWVFAEDVFPDVSLSPLGEQGG